MQTELITTTDGRWTAVLARAPHDVYHLPGYAQLGARQEGGAPAALYARDGAAECLIPLVVRPLPSELVSAGGPLSDALSPYGYASPIFTAAAQDDQIDRLLRACVEEATRNGIVTLFLRLHPLLQTGLPQLGRLGTLVQHGEVVVVDLTASDEARLSGLASGHRYEIRRLVREGFAAAFDDWERLLDFAELYRATMRRVNAHPSYMFDDTYFLELRKKLGDSLHLCLVRDQAGDLAAGALFTSCGELMQYHLSGAAEPFLRLSPTKLALDRIIAWGLDHGMHLLNLGGGVSGKADSLFRFKAGFSPGRATFSTCRIVTDQAIYRQLLERWENASGVTAPEADGFFPPYRASISTK